MVNKISGLMQHLTNTEIKEVRVFLYGLPVLGEEILSLIAAIFEKIEDYSQFTQFIPLYTRTYESMCEKDNTSNRDSLARILMMIPTDENVRTIHLKLADLYKRNKSNSLSANDLNYLSLLHDEAICKINQVIHNFSSGSDQLSEKNKKIINLVFEALQSEAIIGLEKHISLMADEKLGKNKVWL